MPAGAVQESATSVFALSEVAVSAGFASFGKFAPGASGAVFFPSRASASIASSRETVAAGGAGKCAGVALSLSSTFATALSAGFAVPGCAAMMMAACVAPEVSAGLSVPGKVPDIAADAAEGSVPERLLSFFDNKQRRSGF